MKAVQSSSLSVVGDRLQTHRGPERGSTFYPTAVAPVTRQGIEESDNQQADAWQSGFTAFATVGDISMAHCEVATDGSLNANATAKRVDDPLKQGEFPTSQGERLQQRDERTGHNLHRQIVVGAPEPPPESVKMGFFFFPARKRSRVRLRLRRV